MSIMSMINVIPVLVFILKLRGEEKRNRTEHLLARAVSRPQLMGSYLMISFVASFVMQLLSIIGIWFAGAAVMEEPIPFGRMFNTGMVYLPAIWIMIGVAVFLIGYLPKAISFIWLYLVYTFIVVYLGGILQIPGWMKKLSPFGNVPQIPVEEMNIFKITILITIAFVLMVVGVCGYRKRDVQTS